MGKPAYTAVVLKPSDQEALRLEMSSILDAGFRDAGFVERNSRGDRLSHHMTLCLGACPEKLSKYLGKKCTLTIEAWGNTEKALAVRVLRFNLLDLTNVKTPHITVAVNPGNSGSPKDSNEIVEWTPFSKTFQLEGLIEEVCH